MPDWKKLSENPRTLPPLKSAYELFEGELERRSKEAFNVQPSKVCEDCGGKASMDDKRCPHCGSKKLAKWT